MSRIVVTDPCMNCGCRERYVVDELQSFGRPAERRQCRHCRKQTVDVLDPDPEPEVDPDAPVPFGVTRCPSCDSVNTIVTHTTRPLRRHRCRDCGQRFQSDETLAV